MNAKKLELYKALATFLGHSLGSNFEIVLHVLEAGNYHIGAIENNHISGRTTNSPVTDFALKLMSTKAHERDDFVVNYKAETINGKKLKGSTFFIKDEDGNLEGLLCINQDISQYEDLSQEILKLAGLSNAPVDILDLENQKRNDTVEILEESIEDMVNSIVEPDLLNGKVNLNKEAKLEIIRQLNDKGVFQIKGAVAKVAVILKISEPSIYRYVKIVSEE